MPEQKESIDQILQAGWYLLELINEILDLSLIESGKLSLSPECISLAEVLADCHAMIEPQAHKSGLRLNFSLLDGPCFVNADRTRVKQVFINLLSNAIKYNRVGGLVEVTCDTRSAHRTRISFRDTGEGLGAEKIAQLFQPFNRLGQELGAEEGTGIGLLVSKRLVELMGGKIGMSAFLGDAGSNGATGWNESKRALLQAKIAGREPFLDFAFSRSNPDGSQQQFRVSGEPMFNESCRFTGYRGIGVEETARATTLELGGQ